MKRLLFATLAVSFILSGSGAFAIIDTHRLLTEDYLLNSGYSPETVRIMKIRQIDPYAPHEKKPIEKNPLSYLKKFYQYMDPATDNETFGTDIIDPRVDWPSRMQNNY